LRDAQLRDAQLRDAQLRDAQLRDAQLRDAQLRDAQLRDAQLRDAQLRDAQLLLFMQSNGRAEPGLPTNYWRSAFSPCGKEGAGRVRGRYTLPPFLDFILYPALGRAHFFQAMFRSTTSTLPLRTLGLMAAFSCPLGLPALAQDASAPRLQLSGEEATGVYFDRDTLVPQTPVLFSARLQNPTDQTREVQLSWQITDEHGQVVWSKRAKFSLEGGASILRRELFDPPARGGFLLRTQASYSRRGPDASSVATLPFAVTLAPPTGSANGARPRSFFVLDAPSSPDATGLNFYSRLGARVLRSPLVANPSNPDWSAVQTQLGERLRRGLSSIAVLDLGEDGARGQTFWARQVPSTLARYNALSTWELAGQVDASDLDSWSQLARARRPDLSLLSPLPALPSGVTPSQARLKSGELDGATFGWPLARTQSVHPAALRRLWLSRALAVRQAGLQSLHLRRADATGDGGEMTADYLSAIMAGASSMSEPVSPPSTLGGSGAKAMARAAAFTMLSRTLEDAAFREQLFPKSPTLEGALFRTPRGSVAVLYAPLQACKMTLRVSPAQVLDAYGNPLSASNKGQLEVRLGPEPVYIASAVSTEVLSYALRSARVSGLDSLAAQLLPLSRVPGTSGPGSAAVRVRLQNIGLDALNSQIQLKAPRGWKLARDKYDIALSPGQSKTFEFRATSSPVDAKAALPFALSARGGTRGDWKWNATLATAQSVAPRDVPVVDGKLDDWSNANWLRCAPNAAGVGGELAFKWDAGNLYIAAKVHENALTARNPEAPSYDFWRGFDAIQLAFGTSNGPGAVPGTAPFRDADFGFLLSPWLQSDGQNFQGRVLRLWSPGQPYNTSADRVRWGGVASNSKCVIARDEPNQSTIYEARLPLSSLHGLNPKALAQKDGAIRFGFLIHNAEGAPLDWGTQNGNFSWWDNTSTFLPEGRLTSSLRSTLGFTLAGELAQPVVPSSNQNPPKVRVQPKRTPPKTRPVVRPAPLPPPSIPILPAPPTPTPVPLEPSLPPLAVPDLPLPSNALDSNATTPASQIVPFVVPPADQRPPRENVAGG